MHAMGRFNVILVKGVFKIPDDYEVENMVAIGYQSPNDILREKFQIKNTKHRERKPLSQIAFLKDLGHGIQEMINEE